MGGIELAIAVVGAVAIGLAVGWLTAAARVRSGDPQIVIIVSVITPYAAYIDADQVEVSGILAVVVAGLHCEAATLRAALQAGVPPAPSLVPARPLAFSRAERGQSHD